MCAVAFALGLFASGAAQGPDGRRGGTRVAAGAGCPPGTTEVRPGSCQAPQAPAPSIVDYRPKSTLVTPSTRCRRQSSPPSTFTATRGNVSTPDAINRVVAAMDPLNLRVMVVADNSPATGSRRRCRRSRPARTRIASACSPASTFATSARAGPTRRRQQLEADIKAGAVGVGEISQGVRPEHHQARRLAAEGRRSRARSAVGGVRAARRAGVHPHRGAAGVLPAARLRTTSAGSSCRCSRAAATTSPGRSTFEQLMTERNNVFRKHPKTRFIAAHFGWHANDLARAGEDARRVSRTSPSKSARCSTTSAASRAPRTTSSSSTRTASCSARTRSSPTSIPYYWRVFETDGRVLRLLPRLSRVLEAVRDGAAGRRAEEGLRGQRAARDEGVAGGQIGF